MGNPIDGPPERWRGIDPEWAECGGLSYTNLLVRAPCETVVRAVQGFREMPRQRADLLASGARTVGRLREEPVFVYQLRGHDWTQVETWGVALTIEMATDLSRRLRTRAFLHEWEDVASALGYQLLDRGELIEAYRMLHDNPVYQGAQGEVDLRRMRTQGWRISRDHTYEFLSKRGTELDINSPAECQALLGRVAEGEGMFIACLPFSYDAAHGSVDGRGRWTPGHFVAANVLHRPAAE